MDPKTRSTDISLDEAIFTLRSMRHLKPDPIPASDLEYIVEAATMAPSAGNYQMWAFVVVTDEAKRMAIGKAYQEVASIYVRDIVLADPNTADEQQRVYTQAMHTVDHLGEAPAIVVACLTQPCPNDANIASGLFASIYPSVQNMMLAARARGIGSTLLTLGTDFSPLKPEKNPSVREILDLPDGVESAALVPLGYPEGKWGRPRREAAADCLHWEGWTA